MCKKKVAPIHRVTLPRSELCAAHLSAKLTHQLRKNLNIHINEYYYWCDSTIVLSWLQKPPNVLKTFVANRVSKIISLTNKSQWRYVSSLDNPADIISRGSSSKLVINSMLWWHGPSWLATAMSNWPSEIMTVHDNNLPEVKVSLNKTMCNNQNNLLFQLIDKYSELTKLKRVIARCLRFLKNCKNRGNRTTGALQVSELDDAIQYLVKAVQEFHFSKDITNLKENGYLPLKSSLRSLHPFVGSSGILRVGGRLSNSSLNYDQKYPKILPAKHHMTELIIRDTHQQNLHAGPHVVLAIIRQSC